MKSILCEKKAFRAAEEEKAEEQKEAFSEALQAKFLKTRQILLTGEVNKNLSEKIVRQLLILEADSDKPIYLFIDSPGGDVDAGYAIFDMIRFIKAPVYTVGMGLVASAGALIYLPRLKKGVSPCQIVITSFTNRWVGLRVLQLI